MKYLQVTMPDNSKWIFPVSFIIQDRVDYYVNKRGEDRDQVVKETMALFDQHPEEIEDWAENNMDWEDDVVLHAQKIEESDIDYQDGWVNGEKSIVER